jgi:predicted alpha/beta-fold hydrolase
LRRSFLGHFWTVGPHVIDAVRGLQAPRDEPWDTLVDDAAMGPVRLTGWLRDRGSSDTLVLIIHGLGGSVDSRYVVRSAKAAHDAGLAYLRLNLRGADGSGEDIYHAGLTDDLRAALASPALARFERIYVIGFSMGGHITLRWAVEPGRDPRVKALACVCAPLDLAFGVRVIQRPLGRPYQWHVLRGLKAGSWAAAVRGRLPAAIEEVMAVRTFLEWDAAVVTRRFGFASPAEYYERTSAGPTLASIDLPTLFVAAEDDPMVTADQLRPWLDRASGAVDVRWTARGGHVGFPSDVDLGFGAQRPLEPQMVRWLLSQS